MEKYAQVVKNLIGYSLKLKPGDQVVIDATGKETMPFVEYFVEKCVEQNIECEVWFKTKKETVKLWNTISEEDLKKLASKDLAILKKSKAYLRLTSFSLDRAGIEDEAFNRYKKIYFKKVHTDYRVNNMEWCILGFASREFAKESHMNKKAFEDYVISTTSLDYSKMAKALKKLKAVMEKTDKVHLVAPGTDLTFSIKDMPIIPCCGEKNLPDGEIYCAPVRESMNGKISYNTISFEGGHKFSDICFEIKNGKIINATAGKKTKEINKILDIDKNARYFGEFSLGVNPYVTKAVGNTLFDEKISGSIHLTPGCCYEDSPNGNVSVLHWDLVLVLKKDFGGGEICFDDTLIQKDGIFVPKALQCLNPENLK